MPRWIDSAEAEDYLALLREQAEIERTMREAFEADMEEAEADINQRQVDEAPLPSFSDLVDDDMPF